MRKTIRITEQSPGGYSVKPQAALRKPSGERWLQNERRNDRQQNITCDLLLWQHVSGHCCLRIRGGHRMACRALHGPREDQQDRSPADLWSRHCGCARLLPHGAKDLQDDNSHQGAKREQPTSPCSVARGTRTLREAFGDKMISGSAENGSQAPGRREGTSQVRGGSVEPQQTLKFPTSKCTLFRVPRKV